MKLSKPRQVGLQLTNAIWIGFVLLSLVIVTTQFSVFPWYDTDGIGTSLIGKIILPLWPFLAFAFCVMCLLLRRFASGRYSFGGAFVPGCVAILASILIQRVGDLKGNASAAFVVLLFAFSILVAGVQVYRDLCREEAGS